MVSLPEKEQFNFSDTYLSSLSKIDFYKIPSDMSKNSIPQILDPQFYIV